MQGVVDLPLLLFRSLRRAGLASVVAVVAACGSQSNTTGPSPFGNARPWADEFEGPAGATPDPSVWTYDLGNNGGWGNGELQTYTAGRQNAELDGRGHLVIHVESTSNGYRSARLKTQGLRTVHFGRLEARIRIPSGQGLWPALWMLGATFDGSNWPQAGEIDLAEFRGSAPSIVHATVHGPQYSGGRGITASHTLGADSYAADFHTFTLVWAPRLVRFFVDGGLYHTVTPGDLPAGAPWVFDQPFFVLLNVAVGGNFVGAPDSTTQFPQDMLVDYVRYIPSE